MLICENCDVMRKHIRLSVCRNAHISCSSFASYWPVINYSVFSRFHGSFHGLNGGCFFCTYVTDVAMPVRAVCKPHSPDLKKRRSSD